MSISNAPAYPPNPYNPTVYENINESDASFLSGATLTGCDIQNSSLTNCVFVGPIFSSPISTTDNLTVGGNLILNGTNKTLQLNSTGGIYCGGQVVTVTEPEISRLAGVTSNIQTQLNNRLITNSFSTTTNNVWTSVNGKYDTDATFSNMTTRGAYTSYTQQPGSGAYTFFVNSEGATNGSGGGGGFSFYCKNAWLPPDSRGIDCNINNPQFQIDGRGTLRLKSGTGNGNILCAGATPSAVTVTQQEISYLSGVTSNIQTQINNINYTAANSQYGILWPGNPPVTIPAGYSVYNILVEVGFHGTAISLPNILSQKAEYVIYGSSPGTNTYTVIFPSPMRIRNMQDSNVATNVINNVTTWNFTLNTGQYLKFFQLERQNQNDLLCYGFYS
jgi:hypothetical protein